MADVLFIGDDFTGASDCLATYARYGWSTSLMVNPSPEMAGATTFDAPGIPTDLRSLSPDDARQQIGKLWPTIAKMNPRVIHYKVCSTFDSGPEIGSIGATVAELARRFAPDVVAVIGGQPSLRRYCAFGNLFAASLDGKIHRVDKHPVMSVHPVTPMTEGNLITHLSAQGLEGLQEGFLPEISDTDAMVAKLREGPVLLDAVSNEDLAHVGRALKAAGGRQLLIGSSSVAEILAGAAPRQNVPAEVALPASKRLFVFAGSRSSSTSAQIAAATKYRMVELPPDALRSGSGLAETAGLLAEGHAVLAHLVPGADYGVGPGALSDLSVGFVSTLLERVDVGYLGLAGGDTSSRICGNLGFSALDFWRQIGSGVCVCTTRHASPRRHDMRVMLKGGQMGEIGIFDRFLALKMPDGKN
jgi:uncharacterized protein YgbK (DUF1537 family)